MALYKAGTFVVDTVNPTQDVAVGFFPKAVVLFASGARQEDGSLPVFTNCVREQFNGCIGFSDGVANRAVGTSIGEGILSSPGHERADTVCLLIVEDSGGTSEVEATVTFTATGFRLNYTEQAFAYFVGWVAIGGVDVKASVGDFASPNGVGGTQDVDIGFKATQLLTTMSATNPGSETQGFPANNGANDYFQFGCTDGFLCLDDGSINAFTQGTGHNGGIQDQLFNWSDDIASDTADSGRVTARVGETGFRIDWGSGDIPTPQGQRWVYLALQNAHMRLGTVVQPATPTSVAETGLGFEPAGVLFFHRAQNAPDTIGNTQLPDFKFGIGWADETDEWAQFYLRGNGAGNSADGYMTEDACIVAWDSNFSGDCDPEARALESSARLTSLDADGFTLQWTIHGSWNNYSAFYCAFGETATGNPCAEEIETPGLVRAPLLADCDFGYEFDEIIDPAGNVFRLSDGVSKFLLVEAGTGIPPTRYLTQRAPYLDGEQLFDYRLGARSVRQRFRWRGSTRSHRWQLYEFLINAIRPNRQVTPWQVVEPLILRKYLPDGSRWDLKVMPDAARMGQRVRPGWDEWALDETLRFVAHDPVYFDPDTVINQLSDNDDQLTFSNPEQTFVGGADFEPGERIWFGGFLQTLVTYDGNWFAEPVIRITGPVIEPIITNDAIQERIGLDYSLAAGEIVTIDTREGTRSIVSGLNGSITGLATDPSQLATFRLEPDPTAPGGENPIRLFGTGTDDQVTGVQVEYQRRKIALGQ